MVSLVRSCILKKMYPVLDILLKNCYRTHCYSARPTQRWLKINILEPHTPIYGMGMRKINWKMYEKAEEEKTRLSLEISKRIVWKQKTNLSIFFAGVAVESFVFFYICERIFTCWA